MKRYKATCYPSVDEFDCGEVEANDKEDARKMFQEVSDANFGFLVLMEDIEEVQEDE